MKELPAPWTPERANAWASEQPWPLGCNFLPSTAINQLEMFQPATFDVPTLERELGWAAGVGMNTLRVFLHDQLWESDAGGFFRTLDRFLDLCAARHIRPLLVFFDACHRPEPRVGEQPKPIPGLHNPGWAQSPAVSRLRDRAQWGILERYVRAVLDRYGADARVLAWDLYNEPCNGGFDGNHDKAADSAALVREVFAWARAARPAQPLTVCVWNYRDANPLQRPPGATGEVPERYLWDAQELALANSDVVSFHHYGRADDLALVVRRLRALGRPVWCTEYMARTAGSHFQTCLPVLAAAGVGAFNWGFVSGKSQTIFPWGSPEGAPEPSPWFHDVLRPDGTAFDAEEVALLRRLAPGR